MNHLRVLLPREDSYSASQASLTSLTSRAAEEMYIAQTHPSTATDGGPSGADLILQLQPTSSEPLEFDRSAAAHSLVLEHAVHSTMLISDANNLPVDGMDGDEGHHPDDVDTTHLIGVEGSDDDQNNDDDEEEEDEDIDRLQPPSSARYSPLGYDDRDDPNYSQCTDGHPRTISPSPCYKSRTVTPEYDVNGKQKGLTTSRMSKMGGIDEESDEEMYGMGQYSVSPGLHENDRPEAQNRRRSTKDGYNGINRSIASLYRDPQSAVERRHDVDFQWIRGALQECDPDTWHVHLENFKRNKVSDHRLRFLKDADWKELIPIIGIRRMVIAKYDGH